jgi:hypothetical protein
MSNMDPPDVCILQDLTRYRVNPFQCLPATIGPLLVSGMGDYWIAHECAGFSQRRSIGVASAMAGATVILFMVTGAWTLPWYMMWIETLILGTTKWLVMKYIFQAPVDRRAYAAYVLFSFTFSLSQWVYAATHMFRI